MARRWTVQEETARKKELRALYVVQNKTIREVGVLLGVAEQTVYQRLIRLGIKTQRNKKPGVNKMCGDVRIPRRSPGAAEFLGIMLGDGHLTHFQVFVTLGTKEKKYAQYVSALIERVFGVRSRTLVRQKKYRDVYFGSVKATSWLFEQGLVSNKVKSQVGAPRWVFDKKSYLRAFLRGFFDTDGSVYKLKFGVQISLTNRSLPLLVDLRKMLKMLGYKPSEISAFRVYLTRRKDIRKFFTEVIPANQKHRTRFRQFASVG